MCNLFDIYEVRDRLDLQHLMNNFRRVFKNDPPSTPANYLNKFEVSDLESPFVIVTGEVTATTSKKFTHHVQAIKFYKTKPDAKKLRVTDLVDVKCSCEAFHFYVAYAILKSGNFLGKPKDWNTVPSDIRNPSYIPAPCKHIVALVNQLVRKGFLISA